MQGAFCQYVTNTENLSWEKDKIVENVIDNCTINSDNNSSDEDSSDSDSRCGSDTRDVKSFMSNLIPLQCRKVGQCFWDTA